MRENERLHTLKLTEGDDDLEMIVTRHSQFQTPINIINLYGAVESRSTNEKINERWNRVREQVTRIEGSGELVVIIGDLNAHVGNMIEGNDMKVSHGGKLVKEFVESGHYTLLNATNKAKDGPFTRVDPGDVEKKSALDLCIISAELFPYVESLIIDKNKSFTPYRSMNKSVVKYSDHFSLLIVFKGLPLLSEVKGIGGQKRIRWNTNREGGWEVFKELTTDNPVLIDVASTVNVNPEKLATKFENEIEKVKSKAFGKVMYNKLGLSWAKLSNSWVGI